MIVQLIQASWDVAADDQEHPTMVQLSLKSSKTDPFRFMSGLPLPHPEFVSRVKAVVVTSPSPLGRLGTHVAKLHTEGREGLES